MSKRILLRAALAAGLLSLLLALTLVTFEPAPGPPAIVGVETTAPVTDGGATTIQVDLGSAAKPRSLKVQVNREDVTPRVRFAGRGATVDVDTLDPGANEITATVLDRDGNEHKAQATVTSIQPEVAPDIGRMEEIVHRLLDLKRAAGERRTPARDLVLIAREMLGLLEVIANGERAGRAMANERERLGDFATRIQEAESQLGGYREPTRATYGAAAERMKKILNEVEKRRAGELMTPLEELANLLKAPAREAAATPHTTFPLQARPDPRSQGEHDGRHFHSDPTARFGSTGALPPVATSDPSELLQELTHPTSPDQLRTLGVGQNVAHASEEVGCAPVPGSHDPGDTALSNTATGVLFDAQLAPEDPLDPIVAQVNELNCNPIAIYEFVRNEVEFDPAQSGLTRGARSTLLARRGNNPDQVALLVALMRAAGFRAKFVIGDILVDEVDALSWFQAEIPGNFRNLVGEVGPQPKVSSGGTGAVFYEHWWAKVEVPYGEELDRDLTEPLRWIFLDPSFKKHDMRPFYPEFDSSSENPGYEFCDYYDANFEFDLGLDPSTGGGYLGSVQSVALGQYYADAKRSCLNSPSVLSNLPVPRSLADVPLRGPIQAEVFGALPAALPYQALQYHWEFADIEELTSQGLDDFYMDLLRPRLVIEARSGGVGPGSTLHLGFSEPIANWADRRVALGWTPSLPGVEFEDCYSDENCNLDLVLRLDGETPATPPPGTGYTSDLGSPGPKVWIGLTHPAYEDGEDDPPSQYSQWIRDNYLRQAEASFDVGEPLVFAIDVGQGSPGLSRRVMSSIEAAYQELGLAHPGEGPQSPPIELSEAEYRDLIEGVLHLAAVRFSEHAQNDLELVGALEHVRFSYFGVGVTTANSEVLFLNGSPVGAIPRNLLIDIVLPHFASVSMQEAGNGDGEFIRQMGRIGLLSTSTMEHRIWEELTRYETVSTVKGLQLANELPGMEVVRFEKDVIPTASQENGLSAFGQEQVVKYCYTAGVRDNCRRTLVVHKGELQKPGWDWTGGVAYVEGTNTIAALINGANGAATVAAMEATTEQFFESHTQGFDANTVQLADPVSAISGGLSYSETDFQIPTLGSLPLSISRIYNSQIDEDGPFGFGWTHSYNVYIETIDDDVDGNRELTDPGTGTPGVDDDGQTSGLAVVDSSGSHRRFVAPTGTGPFSPESGERGFLTFESATDELVYTTEDGITFHFESFGSGNLPGPGERVYLRSVVDQHGFVTTLNYELSPGGFTRLESVDDPYSQIDPQSSRRIEFDYGTGNDELHIEHVTDWTGRTWTYEYDPAGDLRAVFTPIDTADPSSSYTYYSNQLYPHNDHNLESATRGVDDPATPTDERSTSWFYYYSNDFAYKTVDAAGAETRFVYNLHRRETVEIDAFGRETAYGFNDDGRLARIDYPDGTVELREYESGYETKRTDTLGQEWHRAYDDFGNLLSETTPPLPDFPLGVVTTYRYYYQDHPAEPPGSPRHSKLVKLTEPRSTEWRFSYNDAGQLELEEVEMSVDTTDDGVENPTLQWVELRLRAFQDGILVKEVENRLPETPAVSLDEPDAEDRVTYYTYGDGTARHQLVRVFDELGARTDYAWDDGCGIAPELLCKTTTHRVAEYPDGTIERTLLERSTQYDDLGRPVVTTFPSKTTRTIQYDSHGRVESETLAEPGGQGESRQTSFDYDPMGRLLSATDAAGQARSRTYDLVGNLVKEIDRSQRGTRYRYDARNRVISVRNAAGHEVRLVRDGLGRIRRSIDPLGGVSSREYDARGNVTASTDADGYRTEFRYDENGNRVGVLKGRLTKGEAGQANLDGYSTTWELDPLNRVVLARDARNGETEFALDLFGNPRRIENETNKSTTQLFNRAGRMVRRTDPLTAEEHYRYDNLGTLISATKPDGTLKTYHYDLDNLEVRVEYAPGGAGGTPLEYRYSYNAFGERTAERGPGSQYYNSYDELGRLTKRIDARLDFAQFYRYDPEGRLIGETGGSGGITHYRYNATGRLSTTITPDGSKVLRHYDPAGRMISEDHPDGYSLLTYTDAGRVETIQLQGNARQGLYSYEYDANGNPKARRWKPTAGNQELTAYTYTNLDQLASVAGPYQEFFQDPGIRNYTYDPAGNRETETYEEDGQILESLTFFHNDANQLTAVFGPTVRSYSYTANGERKTFQEGTGPETTYSYDLRGQLKRVDAPSGTWRYGYDALGQRMWQQTPTEDLDYVWSRGNRAEVWKNESLYSRATYGPGLDDLQAIHQSGTTVYAQKDGLGNVVALATESFPTKYSYEAFGLADISAVDTMAGPHDNDIGFHGREFDGNGLMYYRARYYDPAVGRFLQEDPIEFAGGMNFYAFAANNPIRFRDPLGLSPSDYPGGGNDSLTTTASSQGVVLPGAARSKLPPQGSLDDFDAWTRVKDDGREYPPGAVDRALTMFGLSVAGGVAVGLYPALVLGAENLTSAGLASAGRAVTHQAAAAGTAAWTYAKTKPQVIDATEGFLLGQQHAGGAYRPSANTPAGQISYFLSYTYFTLRKAEVLP